MSKPKISIRTLFWITFAIAAFFAGRATTQPTIRVQQMEIRELKESMDFIAESYIAVYDSVREKAQWQPGMLDPNLVPLGLRQPFGESPAETMPIEQSSFSVDLPLDSTEAPLE